MGEHRAENKKLDGQNHCIEFPGSNRGRRKALEQVEHSGYEQKPDGNPGQHFETDAAAIQSRYGDARLQGIHRRSEHDEKKDHRADPEGNSSDVNQGGE